MPKPDLDNAYSLKTPDDSRQLYGDWAETYDETFAEAMDYAAPRIVAQAFVDAGGAGPVLDFGCGTGLVGEHLARAGIGPVDGLDLSPEMLGVARRKGVYRDLIEGNILAGLDLPANSYAGVTCSGTFTHGHVGPDAIDVLLRLAAPRAQFALSINAEHYQAQGFAAKFDALADQIIGLDLPEVRLYGANATGPHKDDTGLIALFRKA